MLRVDSTQVDLGSKFGQKYKSTRLGEVDLGSKFGQKYKSTRLGEVRVDSESTQNRIFDSPQPMHTYGGTKVCKNCDSLRHYEQSKT